MRKCARHILQKIAVVLLILSQLLVGTSFADTLATVQVKAAPLSSTASALNGMVRVYLSSLGSPTSLTLTIAGNYSINGSTSLSSGETVTVGFSSSTGAITLTRNGVKTNMGTYFALRRHSTSGTNGVKIAQARKPANPYPGDLSFRAVQQSSGSYKLYTVAHVYIEEYLYGVLPYEMGSSASVEALKAQAVAARTYTVRMMNSRSSGYYDVVDTTSDQVYNGTPSDGGQCTTAVDATKGVVLKYGDAYAATYYSASNGGQTESIANAWGTSGYPYLTVKDDPFDYANPNSTVKSKTVYADCGSSANNASLMSLLKSKTVASLQSSGYRATTDNTTLGTIKSIAVNTPKYSSPSKLYTKMDFTLTATTINASGAQTSAETTVTCGIFTELESMLGMSIQSSANELWSVQSNGTSFTLQARRYGHGLGLSQRGAMYMGKLGYTYAQILGFYFEGCTRVGCTFTNTILAAGSSDTITTDEPSADVDGSDSGACTAIVKTSALSIRADRADSAKLLCLASVNSPLAVLSNDGTWCMVRYGSIRGYAKADELTITGEAPTDSSESVTTTAGFATVKVSGYLNLRQSGSYSASVVSTAPNGAIVAVLEKGTSWARIQYAATDAYASCDYLTFSDAYPDATTPSVTPSTEVAVKADSANLMAEASESALVLAQLTKGASVTMLEKGTLWCSVSYGGVNGFVLTASLDVAAESLTAISATVSTQSGSLNLRREAGAGSTILTTIPRGATVSVTQRGATWSAVTYAGVSGYVMTTYLAFGDNDSDGGMTDVSATATVTTASGSLNLRQQAKAGSAILRTIPRLATVSVQSKGSEWCAVTYDGTAGYVMTAFLTFTDNAATPTLDPNATATPTLDPNATATPTLDPNATATPTLDPNATATPTPTETTSPDGAITAVVTTASGSLNLRAEALASARVLTRIPKGATIVIQQKMAAWSLTAYNGVTGYVMNTFLTFPSSGSNATDTTNEKATVTTASGSLNLRNAPSGAILCTIPQYATIEVQQRGSSWCYVGYNGVYGYVMTAYLTFSNVGEAVESTPPSNTPSDTPASAPSATAAPLTATVQTSSGSLNLRAEASANADILTAIPRGSTVSVRQRAEQWCAVDYNGLSGYVMTKYLAFAEAAVSPTASPETSATPSPTADTSADTQAAWVVTPSGSLNLRAEASSDAEVIATIARLTQVRLVKRVDAWSQISYGSLSGYVMSKYLSLNDPSGASATPAVATATPDSQATNDATTSAPTNATPTPTATLAPTATPTPTATPAPTEAPTYAEDATLQAPAASTFAKLTPTGGEQTVKLYQACSKESTMLLEMIAQAEVRILRRGDRWSEVLYYDQQGFCLTEELTIEQFD